MEKEMIREQIHTLLDYVLDGNGDGAKENLRREIDKKSAEIEAANATLNELMGKLAELESAQE